MVQFPIQSPSRAIWSVSSCRLRVRVDSVKMCCSCRLKSDIKARWASSRKVPSWAKAVIAGSGEDRGVKSADRVLSSKCSSFLSRWDGGRYLIWGTTSGQHRGVTWRSNAGIDCEVEETELVPGIRELGVGASAMLTYRIPAPWMSQSWLDAAVREKELGVPRTFWYGSDSRRLNLDPFRSCRHNQQQSEGISDRQYMYKMNSLWSNANSVVDSSASPPNHVAIDRSIFYDDLPLLLWKINPISCLMRSTALYETSTIQQHFYLLFNFHLMILLISLSEKTIDPPWASALYIYPNVQAPDL